MVEENRSSSGSKPSLRWLATGILGLIFMVALIVYLAGSLLSKTLVDPELYNSALAESQFYERIYSDLLTDPAMAAVKENVLGDLKLDPAVAEDTQSFAASMQYLVLPPADIQAAVERGIDGMSGYLVGDNDTLASGIELYSLDEKLLGERLIDGSVAYIADLFAGAETDVPEVQAGYDQEQLANYMAGISDGQLGPVPDQVAVASVADLSPEEIQDLIALLVGPAADSAEPGDLLQIESALRADHLVDAIALASAIRLRSPANLAAADLLAPAKDAEKMDVIVRLSKILERSPSELRGQLGRIRTTNILLKWVILPLELIILVLALGGIILTLADDVQALLRTAGVALIVGSILFAVGWRLVGSGISTGLDHTFQASGELPVALERMIADVVSSVIDNAWTDVWQMALVPLAIGLVLVVVSLVPSLPETVNRWPFPLFRYRNGIVAGIVLLIVLLPLGWLLFYDRDRGPQLACNGHAELCDRPVNAVALATTHNAMAVSEHGWLWPTQDGTVTNQLKAGVRGLLIESHYWDDEAFIEEAIQNQPVEVQAAILDNLDLADVSKEDGVYLCSMMCGLGATFLTDMLSEVRAFLDSHPNEVIVMVIADEISAEDTAAAFTASGLQDRLYVYEAGEPWPTLRQMIDEDKQLLVMAENGGPPPDFYLHAWDYLEETPDYFRNPDELDETSCQPNRGDTGKPFFLLNHWKTGAAPSRVDASLINESETLLARAQRCAEERGQTPNLVAVDFYLNGDVFEVVDTLNGVDGAGNGQ